MPSRKLFCVNDPSHAGFGWAAESRFLHIRKYDALGNTTSQWTFPVPDTAPGDLTCDICGGQVYVAGLHVATGGDVMSCDFLGRCRTTPADANLARLDALAARLADIPFPVERARLAPAVAALLRAVANDPEAWAVVGNYELEKIFSQ